MKLFGPEYSFDEYFQLDSRTNIRPVKNGLKAYHCNVNKQRALSEVSSCVKSEMTVLGSLSLIVLMVSVDVKQHRTRTKLVIRAQELCESRGGRPGIHVPHSPYYGLRGRKATLEE